jgi:hypothetical protein
MGRSKHRKKKNKKVCFLVIIIILIVISSIYYFFYNSKTLVKLTNDEIQQILENNIDLNQTRKEIISYAISIEGKVNYFWGGKSYSYGMDERWGETKKVTSENSVSTGTFRPFGLDCSGYVTWCFLQLGYTKEEVKNLIGSGTWNQWHKSYEIEWEELLPGDLAFKNNPEDGSNHVGICIGYNDKDKPVFAHCSADFDNVVVTEAGDIFKFARRPSVFED